MPPKRPRLSASAELGNEDLSAAIAVTKLVDLEARKAELDEKERKQRIVEEEMAMSREKAASIISLNLRGKVFKTYKETLLKVKDTYFYRMLSSGLWQPDENGEYFIDTRYEGFERVLAYLSSGKLSVKGLNEYKKECVYDNLDYFQIPYPNREWSYSTYSDIDELNGCVRMCELSDGRLCGATEENLVVWNMSTSAVEMSIPIGHTDLTRAIIELADGRICSCSDDRTIRVWNLETETSELTLVHTAEVEVTCIAQLLDGRLHSGSDDSFIWIWNLENGLCEQTIDTGNDTIFFAQLADGRLCTGSDTGSIYLWNLKSGECELTLEGHTNCVNSIVAMNDSRICSGSDDCSVKVWNVYSGQCERTLVGHTNCVFSILRMRDGRLCTGSFDRTIRIWNADTGDCEKVLKADDEGTVDQVLQLQDGRLVAVVQNGIGIWS